MTDPTSPHVLLDAIQDVVYAVDRNARLTFLNAAARRTLNLTADALGRTLAEALKLATDDHELQVLLAALREQHPAQLDVFSGTRQRWIRVHACPCEGGLVVYQHDIHERHQAEEHARALASISTHLQHAVTPGDVARILVEVVPGALRAEVVVVALLEDHAPRLRTVAARGLTEEQAERWASFPLTAPVPLAVTVRDGHAVFVPTRADAERHFPALLTTPRPHDAWAALPLGVDDRTFGGLGLGFPTPRPFDASERAFLHAVAAQAAQALERARLRVVERRALDRATYLARANELLTSSLDPAVVLRHLADLAVPRLADCCIVFLPDEHAKLVPHAVVHRTPERAEALRAQFERFPIDMDAPIGAAKAYRERQPAVVQLPSEELLRTAALTDEHVAAVLALGIRSVLDVPLVARGEALGVIEFLSMTDERHYEADDVVFAEDLARRAALALDNARLYSAVHAASGTLEQMVADRTRELEERTAELAARTRALEAFGMLSRDLATETNREKLVARAQEILLTLLPPAVATYFEINRGRWTLRCSTGPLPDAAFEAVLHAGLERGHAAALDTTFDMNTPLYLDTFDPVARQVEPASLARLKSVACLPVGAGEHLYGVLAIALYEHHAWTTVDRVLLETALSKLRLALERAEAVEGLARRTRELEEANAELDAFTATVSHDLRAPLRHLQSFSMLLRRALGDDIPERALRPLGMIESSSARLNVLVEALLSFAQTSRQTMRVQPVDLDEVVRLAIEDLQLDVTGQKVTWRLSPLPVVRGDVVLLRQVLVNLLSNAVKYSADRAEPTVTVDAVTSDAEVVLRVQDNGVGYDPSMEEKLFGMFVRLHRADEYEGSGIGLATVKRVVQRHGGRVWAHGRPGEGATFYVALPTASRRIT